MGNENLNGNAFLTKEQAKAVGDAVDAFAGLANEHGIHPVYVVGVIEMLKHELIDYSVDWTARNFGGDE